MTNFQKLKSKRLMVGLIGIPMILAVIYYSAFALDRYVSEASMVVRQVGAQGQTPHISGLASMLGGGLNPTSREETLYLREFINSADMLRVLQDKLAWSSHYEGQWRDPLYLLQLGASDEDTLEYYRRIVTTYFDEQTGLLHVSVQGFEPQFAQEVLRVIVSESDRFVNEMSHRMARDQMSFAQTELAKARKDFEARRDALIAFQAQNNLLDPEETAKSRSTAIGELEAKLTTERASLKGLLAVLREDTPQVRQQRVRIQAMEQQLAAEYKRLVSEKEGERLNVIASRYRNLVIDEKISEEAYKYAVNSVESSRVEASKRLRSLVTVVTPNLPDQAIYPERIYNLITIFLGLLVLYGIARFVIATIEDHRD